MWSLSLHLQPPSYKEEYKYLDERVKWRPYNKKQNSKILRECVPMEFKF
jgi:hypothetical protein